ncbi:BPSL0067 family protein [Enterobacter sp.]|uniref:BPSL0067 family protein n=1 Tax=Enterobacter sp. TaxID=42895 RepID=UPI00296EB807|nr:BPSL0067 family protein [Enterobacter sp.]
MGGHEYRIIQKICAQGSTGTWKQGHKALGNKSISRGTAIATFVNGTYTTVQGLHKHVVFCLGYHNNYIYVMDQCKGKRPKVSPRLFTCKDGTLSHGTYPDASNNAAAFYLIE